MVDGTSVAKTATHQGFTTILFSVHEFVWKNKRRGSHAPTRLSPPNPLRPGCVGIDPIPMSLNLASERIARADIRRARSDTGMDDHASSHDPQGLEMLETTEQRAWVSTGLA